MSLPEKLNRFFDKLISAQNRLLMLDYDGTLSPFVEKRDEAFPYDGIPERLQKLVDSPTTRTLIVTGRAIEHIKPLLKLQRLPEIFGSHGWEHLDADGTYHLRKAEPKMIEGLKQARQYIYDNGLDKYLEEKPASIAIHFRGLDSDKVIEIRKKILHNWNVISEKSSLIFSEFDGGLELKFPGYNKGNVVGAVLDKYIDPPAAAYLGDDLTDEDAFAVLPRDAAGILVREEYRETKAEFWIKPPDELLQFLDRWLKIDTDKRT